MSRYKNNNIETNKDTNKKYYVTYKKIKFPKKEDDVYIVWADYHTCHNIAYKYWDDSKLWWVLLSANNKMLESDFFNGEVIRIPINPELIINSV